MSDREGHSGGGAPTEEDLSLPKATVAKMIAGTSLLISLRPKWGELTRTELLPNDIVCAKETRDLVIECCVGERRQRCPWYIWWTDDFVVEFIHLISSEANEICEADSKKTIAPEHIISALTVCRALSCCLVKLTLHSVSDLRRSHRKSRVFWKTTSNSRRFVTL